MKQALWHFIIGDRDCGPVPLETLRGLLASGQVLPTTLVWHESLPSWLPAGEVPALAPGAAPPPTPAEAVAETPPSPPVPSAAPVPVVPCAQGGAFLAYSQRRDDPVVAGDDALEALRAGLPWARGVAAACTVASGLMFLLLLLAVVRGGSSGGMEVPCVVFATFTVLPGVAGGILFSYANRADVLLLSRHSEDLTRAFRALHLLWKFLAIALIFIIILGALFVVMAI